MSGQIIGVEALFLLVSAGVGFCYRETGAAVSLLITAGIAALIFLISQLFRPKDEIIFAKDGFVTVAAAWILLSAVGALPFYISGEIPHYIDAFFETVSGFTTTGASILTDEPRIAVLAQLYALGRRNGSACLYYGNHSCGVRPNHTPYARGNAGTYRR